MADDPALSAIVERALRRLGEASPALADALAAPGVSAPIGRVAQASDFAVATFARQPQVLLDLLAGDAGPPAPPQPGDIVPGEWGTVLRRYRAACSARLVWRDVLGIDQVADTLAGSTSLADTCLQLALEALEADFATRHGHVRHADGSPQRMVVFALG
jgi:glutamate-ammonia-ligase adenylyltransferase